MFISTGSTLSLSLWKRMLLWHLCRPTCSKGTTGNWKSLSYYILAQQGIPCFELPMMSVHFTLDGFWYEASADGRNPARAGWWHYAISIKKTWQNDILDFFVDVQRKKKTYKVNWHTSQLLSRANQEACTWLLWRRLFHLSRVKTTNHGSRSSPHDPWLVGIITAGSSRIQAWHFPSHFHFPLARQLMISTLSNYQISKLPKTKNTWSPHTVYASSTATYLPNSWPSPWALAIL